MNRVTLEGNLGADPEKKTLTTGTMVCDLSVATSRRFQDKEGKWQDTPTMWHRVILFDKPAEWAAKQLKKGARVHLEGELNYRVWDKPEGGKGYATEIRARFIHEIVKPEKTEQSGAGGTSSGPRDVPPPAEDSPY